MSLCYSDYHFSFDGEDDEYFVSALFIYSENGLDKNFKLASANIPRISTLNQKGINVKDLITYDKIFMEQKSIDEITKRLT